MHVFFMEVPSGYCYLRIKSLVFHQHTSVFRYELYNKVLYIGTAIPSSVHECMENKQLCKLPCKIECTPSLTKRRSSLSLLSWSWCLFWSSSSTGWHPWYDKEEIGISGVKDGVVGLWWGAVRWLLRCSFFVYVVLFLCRQMTRLSSCIKDVNQTEIVLSTEAVVVGFRVREHFSLEMVPHCENVHDWIVQAGHIICDFGHVCVHGHFPNVARTLLRNTFLEIISHFIARHTTHPRNFPHQPRTPPSSRFILITVRRYISANQRTYTHSGMECLSWSQQSLGCILPHTFCLLRTVNARVNARRKECHLFCAWRLSRWIDRCRIASPRGRRQSIQADKVQWTDV